MEYNYFDFDKFKGELQIYPGFEITTDINFIIIFFKLYNFIIIIIKTKFHNLSS